MLLRFSFYTPLHSPDTYSYQFLCSCTITEAIEQNICDSFFSIHNQINTNSLSTKSYLYYNRTNFSSVVSIKQGIEIPRQLDIVIRLLLIVLFCCITFWCDSACAETECEENEVSCDSVEHDCDYSCVGCADSIVGYILFTNSPTSNFLVHITTIAPRHLVLEPQYRPPILSR